MFHIQYCLYTSQSEGYEFIALWVVLATNRLKISYQGHIKVGLQAPMR